MKHPTYETHGHNRLVVGVVGHSDNSLAKLVAGCAAAAVHLVERPTETVRTRDYLIDLSPYKQYGKLHVKCRLAGCSNLTSHNKGYCSATCFKASKKMIDI